VQVEYTHMAAFREAVPHTPAILVEHDLTFTLYRQFAERDATSRAQQEYQRWLEFERRAFGLYDAVWTMSDQDRAAAIEAGSDPERTSVVPNGVDLERFHPGLARRWRAPVRESLGLADDRLVLLFVGNNPWVKGLRHALRLIARLPDRYALVVLGPHSSATVAGLEREAAELERSGRLRFAGRQVEVQSYYAAADAVIVPSVYESFGLVVLEGMAMGLPVFTSRAVAAGEELIRDGENGFVVEQPAEVEETARQITALMASPDLRRRVAERARATAEEYSWDRHAARTEELYRGVLAARGVASAGERARA